MPRIDFNQVRFEVEKQIGQIPAYRQAANREANRIFEEAKAEFFEAFDDDGITKELEEGADALGSNFLPDGYGNLFSFIGFYSDERPIEELRAFLETNMTLVQKPVTKPFEYIYKVYVPTEDEVASVTPMPFGTSPSWVLAIEHGIPGFNHYLFDLEREFAGSRSGPAVQTDAKHTIRAGDYEPQNWLFKKLLPAFAQALKE